MNVLLMLASVTAALAASEVRVSARPGTESQMRRSVIGVNHLAYGKNGLGYGMILKGTHTLDPELVAMQKEIGFGSLRYPGGCGGTHGFDWKKNAGFKGPYCVMGLVEFLAMAESCGADPILGISAQRGSPEEAAEYVEFLNAPADAAHPWAQKRAERGHPAPYGVTWFEYGNESYHGRHAPRGPNGKKGGMLGDIDPDDYCDRYLAFRRAMQAVDPKVKLSACLIGGNDLWDQKVLRRIGKVADFFIIHTYAQAPERGADDYLSIFTDRTDYLTNRFARTKAVIGPQAMIGITEFNTRQTQHKTLTAGLVNLQTLMDFAAEPRIVHADFWQFVNEGFGMVRGERGAFVKRPNAWAFQLYANYTLDRLMAVQTEEFPARGAPETGKASADFPEAWRGRNAFDGATFRYYEGGSAKSTGTRYELLPDGTHKLTFLDGRKQNFHQLAAHMKKLPKGDPCVWKVSYEMWVVGDPDPFAMRMEIVDGRGWGATKSSLAGEAVSGVDPIPVTMTYRPLKDNPGSLQLRFRGAGKGTVYVRNIRVEALPKVRPNECPVRAQLSRASDGRSAAGVFINRSFAPRTVMFETTASLADGVRPASVVAEVLSGPDAYATNEEKPDNVTLRPLEVDASRLGDGTVRFTIPPHAAVGVKVLSKEKGEN